MTTAFIAFLALGLTLALAATVLGGHGHGGHGGGHVGDVGHVDSGGDGDGGFPFFSPAVIGSFFAAFGAGGLIAEALGVESLAGRLGSAFGAGVALAALAGFLVRRLVRATESTSHVREADLVASEAEVITEIPANGVGEVALVAHGSRITYPARSESGAAIRRSSQVEVTRIVGETLYVRENIDERFRRLEEAAALPRKPGEGGDR